jgi:hypothetical protein
MGLSDTVYEAFLHLLKEYKKEYGEDGYQYTHRKTFENLLFTLLKSLYVIDFPEQKLVKIMGIPSDPWIRGHIQELLKDD